VSLGSNINTGSERYPNWPNLAFNGLMLFFSSNRSGGQGGGDIWFTTRETTDGLAEVRQINIFFAIFKKIIIDANQSEVILGTISS